MKAVNPGRRVLGRARFQSASRSSGWKDDFKVHIFAIWKIAKTCGLGILRFVHLQVSVSGQNSTGRCMDFAFCAPEIQFVRWFLYLQLELIACGKIEIELLVENGEVLLRTVVWRVPVPSLSSRKRV
jgi:hypothetical protein